MLSCNSSLIAIAAEFTGKFAPYQSICITPAQQGVNIVSTDKGNVACLAYDPAGEADETICLLPTTELIKAARGIKTAERTLRVEGNQATVTTTRKTTSETKEISISRSMVDFPDLATPLGKATQRWDQTENNAITAGRYNISYIQNAVKSLSSINSSVTLHSFDGGPLRIQESSGNIVVLVMPQTAEPIPDIPSWLRSYAAS